MTIWTLYVQSTEGELYDILIDSNKNFSEFRTEASKKVNIPFADLVLIADKDYDKNFNSTKICDLGYEVHDGITFYAVLRVNGGN